MERIARGKHAKYQQYAADNGSKFVPLAMDNHGAIHKEFADFITATAKIAEKRLLFISKVDLHFKTLWSHVFLAVSSSFTMPMFALWFRSSRTYFM